MELHTSLKTDEAFGENRRREFGVHAWTCYRVWVLNLLATERHELGYKL
jgi:hypothetical protein